MYLKTVLLCVALFISMLGIGQLRRFSFTRAKMGSPFTIIFFCADSVRATEAAEACYRLVDSINDEFSDYFANSVLNKLCATAGTGEWKPVSARFFDLLQLSIYANRQSGGAFDVRIGPLSQLWRRARSESRFPEPTEVATALKKVGAGRIFTDSAKQLVLLTHKHMQLDMGGIAKGYAAQAVVDLLGAMQLAYCLADAGGDIVVGERPPGKPGWQLGINLPQPGMGVWNRQVNLYKAAIATSGDMYQYTEHGGNTYSHIIDPRTGYGVTHRRNVTVIANSGEKADWLATACSVLPLNKAFRLVKKMKAEIFIAEWQKGRVLVHQSAGWSRYWTEDEQNER